MSKLFRVSPSYLSIYLSICPKIGEQTDNMSRMDEWQAQVPPGIPDFRRGKGIGDLEDRFPDHGGSRVHRVRESRDDLYLLTATLIEEITHTNSLTSGNYNHYCNGKLKAKVHVNTSVRKKCQCQP